MREFKSKHCHLSQLKSLKKVIIKDTISLVLILRSVIAQKQYTIKGGFTHNCKQSLSRNNDSLKTHICSVHLSQAEKNITTSKNKKQTTFSTRTSISCVEVPKLEESLH